MNTENIDTNILSADKDPMGAAILDFQQNAKAGKLLVRSSMFEDDEMSIEYLFRNEKTMPILEQEALKLAKGYVLDVGAGAGCHALALQERKLAVKAIDISPLSCKAMIQRGVKDVECINLFSTKLEQEWCSQERQSTATDITDHPISNFRNKFDTILLLMNGTGIAGKLYRLPLLLKRLHSLLNEGGQILIDSSDLRYIYEDEDGQLYIDPKAPYYGEVDYQMVYKNLQGKTITGTSFDWLYIDYSRLHSMAQTCGFNCELVTEGKHYDYLARLWPEI